MYEHFKIMIKIISYYEIHENVFIFFILPSEDQQKCTIKTLIYFNVLRLVSNQ